MSTPFQTIVEEDTQKIVTHVSVHTLTFHETHDPLPPPGNPNTIQYLIPGRATNVELLIHVKNWQSPLRDSWSNCLINSRETTKGQTDYHSGRQEDNSKTICFRARQWHSRLSGTGHQCTCPISRYLCERCSLTCDRS